MLMMAYRSTAQETISISPFKMMMGREVNMPIDILFGGPSEEEPEFGSDYVLTLQETLKLSHEWARVHLKRGAERQKRYYDLKSTSHGYSRGDFVWLHTPQRKKGCSPKLQKFWDGPYLIVNKLSDALFRIQRSQRANCKIVHYNRLKLYTGTRSPWISRVEPALELVNEDSELSEEVARQDFSCDSSDSEEEVKDQAVITQNAELGNKIPISEAPPSAPLVTEETVISSGLCSGPRRSKRIVRPPKRLIEEI